MRLTIQTRRLFSWLVWSMMLLVAVESVSAQSASITRPDRRFDATPRVADPGADTSFDPAAHRLIDLRELTVGSWAPDDPGSDLFSGEYATDGDFLRLDLLVDGLVNPPGDADPLAFDPFRYGDHPIYGYVEIDMDDDVWTGGELDAPQYRYLGNIVRFGGKALRPAFGNRMALEGADFDDNFLTLPFVERHGEEFHLALLGWQFGWSDIAEILGNGDGIFDEGETWIIEGPFFHRAHGYEPFSFVEGGHAPGEYAPDCHLRFQHEPVCDVTRLSLVFPLTNVGAGLMRSEPPEPSNQDPTDHASILEALEDLQWSASFLKVFPTGLPEEDLIIDWAERDPASHLDPTEWSVTVLLGTSYTQPDPAGVFYVWTDVYPNVVRGDADGSGAWTENDAQLIAQYIALNDDTDGALDGMVTILGFASDFSVYDINHDGVVDNLDVAGFFRDGDSDRDGDVDLVDVAAFQRCFYLTDPGGTFCTPMDFRGDGKVDRGDFRRFVGSLTGPLD